MCFANSGVSTAPGVVTGDLRSTPLAALTIAPPVYAGFGGPNPYAPTTSLARGEWTATLTDGACPAPAAATSS